MENKTQTVDFTVQEEALQLKEVSVKSEKIWGGNDTVNYVVDAFRDTTDIVITMWWMPFATQRTLSLPMC